MAELHLDMMESISFRSLTILNYIVHNINDLSPGIAYHMFKEKNVLNLFVSLLEIKPWKKNVDNPVTK